MADQLFNPFAGFAAQVALNEQVIGTIGATGLVVGIAVVLGHTTFGHRIIGYNSSKVDLPPVTTTIRVTETPTEKTPTGTLLYDLPVAPTEGYKLFANTTSPETPSAATTTIFTCCTHEADNSTVTEMPPADKPDYVVNLPWFGIVHDHARDVADYIKPYLSLFIIWIALILWRFRYLVSDVASQFAHLKHVAFHQHEILQKKLEDIADTANKRTKHRDPAIKEILGMSEDLKTVIDQLAYEESPTSLTDTIHKYMTDAPKRKDLADIKKACDSMTSRMVAIEAHMKKSTGAGNATVKSASSPEKIAQLSETKNEILATIARLEERIAAIKTTDTSGIEGAVSKLVSRLEETEKQNKANKSVLVESSNTLKTIQNGINGINSRVGGMENSKESSQDSLLDLALTLNEIQASVKGIDSRVVEMEQKQQDTLSKLHERINQLENENLHQEHRESATLNKLVSRIDGLAKGNNQEDVIAKLASRVEDLAKGNIQEKMLAQLASRVEEVAKGNNLEGLFGQLASHIEQLVKANNQSDTIAALAFRVEELAKANNQEGMFTQLASHVEQLIKGNNQEGLFGQLASHIEQLVKANNQDGSIAKLASQVEHLAMSNKQNEIATNLASVSDELAQLKQQRQEIADLQKRVREIEDEGIMTAMTHQYLEEAEAKEAASKETSNAPPKEASTNDDLDASPEEIAKRPKVKAHSRKNGKSASSSNMFMGGVNPFAPPSTEQPSVNLGANPFAAPNFSFGVTATPAPTPAAPASTSGTGGLSFGGPPLTENLFSSSAAPASSAGTGGFTLGGPVLGTSLFPSGTTSSTPAPAAVPAAAAPVYPSPSYTTTTTPAATAPQASARPSNTAPRMPKYHPNNYETYPLANKDETAAKEEEKLATEDGYAERYMCDSSGEESEEP